MSLLSDRHLMSHLRPMQFGNNISHGFFFSPFEADRYHPIVDRESNPHEGNLHDDIEHIFHLNNQHMMNILSPIG